MHIFSNIANLVIDWFKYTTIDVFGYSFTMWDITLVSVMVSIGGYVVGCFLREKE